MAAEGIEVKGLNALEKNAAAAQKVLGGLEKQLKGMCAAMTSLFAGVVPTQALQSAEKTVRRTTTTVRKESKKVLAAFDEIDRVDTDNTTTTQTHTVTQTTTETPTLDVEKVENATLLWENFLQSIAQWTGEVVINALQWLTEKLEGISQWITENQPLVEGIAIVVGSVAAAIALVCGAIGVWNAVSAVGAALTGAFGGAVALLTSPITLVVAAIAALIAIVVLLVKNWDTVKATAIATWQAIKDAFGAAGTWFQEKVLDPLIGGFKGMVNGIIGFLNSMIAGIVAGINGVIGLLNKIKFDIPDWIPGIGGETFGFNLKTLKAPQIPYLAQGAVLPANKPFLAVVGDQKQGTNVEAPLETIKQALAEVMAMQGSGDVNIRFTGDLAQLARVLKPQIDRENCRVGGSVVRRVTG